MFNFLKRLFGLGESKPEPAPEPAPKKPALPPLPKELSDEFLEWFDAQRKPAIALKPDPALPVDLRGSRLFGPALLLEGEEWPTAKSGVPLDLIAQLKLADCAPLEGYPDSGIVQFFIGRDDLYGANFDNLSNGDFLVRYLPDDAVVAEHAPPILEEVDGVSFSDFSPGPNDESRRTGIALVPELIEDRMDLSVVDASKRFFDLPKKYDTDALYDAIDERALLRSLGHHTGGYPAFVQADIRESGQYLEYDHVLLRLTSDAHLCWGDVGECVFMMPSADLLQGDFSRVIYSWDCS